LLAEVRQLDPDDQQHRTSLSLITHQQCLPAAAARETDSAVTRCEELSDLYESHDIYTSTYVQLLWGNDDN